MLSGHYGAALFAKGTFAKRVPLHWLFVCTQIQDFVLVFLQTVIPIEQSVPSPENPSYGVFVKYAPYSHSLFSSILFALVCAMCTPTARAAVFATVLSHWLLDLLVHLPDLDVCFPFVQCPRAGLGLWRWPYISLIVECGIVIVGAMTFARTYNAATSSTLFKSMVVTFVILTCVIILGPSPQEISWESYVPAAVLYILSTVAAWRIDGICQQQQTQGMGKARIF